MLSRSAFDKEKVWLPRSRHVGRIQLALRNKRIGPPVEHDFLTLARRYRYKGAIRLHSPDVACICGRAVGQAPFKSFWQFRSSPDPVTVAVPRDLF